MKKLHKIVSMLLVFSLLVCICPFASAQDTSAEEDDCIGFHAPTIRKMIEVNLECDNADEEFFHLLANAYLADPELLIETIMDLPDDDIAYLAKAIAYDLQKTNRQADVQTDFADPAADVFGRMIALETADTENASLDSFLDEDLLMGEITDEIPDELLALEEVEVSSFSLLADETEVASPVTATISISSTLVSSALRSYSIKFYKKLGTTTSQCGLAVARILPNGMAASASANLVFNETGVYDVYAEVYDMSGTLLATSSNVRITVKGRWHITVELTEDRAQLGTITLYSASGTAVARSICLGKSADNLPMNQENGHTPIGVYTGYLDPHGDDVEKYGPYKIIYLQGQSGYVVERCSHRSGLLIHGGREGYNNNESDPSYPLHHTEGCVRITNTFQLSLQNRITALINNCHLENGVVTITQDGQITLP